ncbi:MAG: hypothetical protein PVG32_06785 [Anaerolineales bacterium]|jgi:hypothetical protein
MLAKNFFASAIVGICLILVGCNEQRVQVSRAVPAERQLTSETLDIRNCETTEDLHQPLSARLQVTKHISIDEKATLTTTDEKVEVPEEMRAELKTEIERVYQDEFEQAQSGLQQYELFVTANKIHMYKIRWVQREYRSNISFTMDNKPCEASYTYRLDVPEVEGYTEMACTA